MTQQLTTQQYEDRNKLGFEGDHFIAEELKKLITKFKIKSIVETGTFLGWTTKCLAELSTVISIEISDEYYNKAVANLGLEKIYNPETNEDLKHATNGDTIIVFNEDSVSFLNNIHGMYNDKILFFLDAHWGDVCPLKDELKAIANHKVKPVIAIHDWKVPNEPTLGYDSYKGQAFTYEWIKPELDAIYGIDGYDYHYNSDKLSEGAKRGVIYIYPKVVKTKRPRINKTK